MKPLQTLDYVVFLIYFVIVAAYALYIYNRKKSANPDSRDYFLAEGSLTWWAIGASLIASNISAEQFIGMSGSGFKMGLAIASYDALTAAVVASLAGKANSISTIFTLDIYKKRINQDASERRMVVIGRWTIVVAMILAVIIAPHLGIDKKGGFQFIQEYTGFVSPGVFAMFLLGFFWKKTTSNAALFATIGGFILSVVFKKLPDWADLEFLYNAGFSVPVTQADGNVLYEIPFLDRMGFVFVFSVLGMVIISLIENSRGVKPRGLDIDTRMFRMNPAFAAGSLLICGILVALYTIYW